MILKNIFEENAVFKNKKKKMREKQRHVKLVTTEKNRDL